MDREVVRQVLGNRCVGGNDDVLFRPVAVEHVAEPGQQVVVFGGSHDEDLHKLVQVIPLPVLINPRRTIRTGPNN